MDVCDSSRVLRKNTAVATPRQPLLPADRNNAVTTRPSLRSRYKSPSPASSCGPRRCPSPSITRTVPTSSQFVPKRSQSAERKRPCTPPSPLSPSTPIHDSSVDVQLLSKRVIGGRLPESLWPSTMRSLSVSFQSDTISIPVGKKERPVLCSSSDRNLRLSSNYPPKQAKTQSEARKITPERKRSPLKGKNGHDQSENSKPVNSLHTQVVDQHRWPSRVGTKPSPKSLTSGVDLTDKGVHRLNKPLRGTELPSMRTTIVNTINKPSKKTASDAMGLLYFHGRIREESETNLADDNSIQKTLVNKLSSSSIRGGAITTNPAVRYDSWPTPRSRPPSPSKTPALSSVTRGFSPSRTRPSTPPPQGISSSRLRSLDITQSNISTSVLSFIADYKKKKKGANYIEDAHQLRLLYNRYLQWRTANAKAEAALHNQQMTAERTLRNAWSSTLNLWNSVIRKRVSLQQLKLELKLICIINNQMSYLDEWAVLERSHIQSLSGAMHDLEASTLRVPVTGVAKVDVDSLSSAMCSAVAVMQMMGSSICSLLSKADVMHQLVFELAVVVAEEKAMLDECIALLAAKTMMQVQEQSLWTHLVQMRKEFEKGLPV